MIRKTSSKPVGFQSIRGAFFRRGFWGAVWLVGALLLLGCTASMEAGRRSEAVAELAASPVAPASTRSPTPSAVLPASTPTATPWYRIDTPTPELVQAHLSFYWPPYRDMNCDVECEHLANADDWQQWVGKGVACPGEYELGTVFVIMGQKWKCVDRGGAIVINADGSIWLDMLMPYMPYGIAWGTVSEVRVIRNVSNNLFEN
ncbi:MAG: hypothetical protein ABFD44_13020 [Anaerolineaceae bacterium]